MTAEEMKADGAPLEGVDITLKRDEGVLKVPAGCGAVPSGVGGGTLRVPAGLRASEPGLSRARCCGGPCPSRPQHVLLAGG